MERVTRFFERLHEHKISQQFDAIILVIGDEGMGKSTFMVESAGRWQQVLGQEPDIDSVLGRLVWETDEFKDALADYPRRAAIPVMDAARVLHKKKGMHTEQIEVETDLLDSRMKENVIFLGYQDWDLVPTMLQKRRAKYAFNIPYRGVVRGYSRSSMDERIEEDEWPDSDLEDRFPNLDGTPIWEEFKRRDRAKKEARMRAGDGEEGEDALSPQEAVQHIKANGILQFVKHNEFTDKVHVNAELINFEYPSLSVRESKQVKQALERDVDVEAVWREQNGADADAGGEGEVHTA